MNRALHLLADDPITEPAQDMLNRRVFAGQVVNVIRMLPAKESSTVLALIGPWGSGKSSLLELVTRALETHHSSEWKTVNFNPWELSSLDGLMLGFFQAVADAIPNDFKTKTAFETLTGYASKFLSLGGALKVPGTMLANAMGFIDPGKALEGLGKLLDNRVSTQLLKKRLEAALAELPHRILIVIDDIDRLMPDELLMVFKLIRMLGRLPGIHYLLAYDEQTLLSVLKESQLARANPDRALAYLEKIVQVRLDLPTVHRVQAREMIHSCVRLLLSGLRKPLAQEELKRLDVLLESELLVRLNEPRSIRRFFAQVAAYMPLVVHRVDLADFVALSYLRTFYPMMYRELHRRKRQLLSGKRAEAKSPAWREGILAAGVPEPEVDTVLGLIGGLFPQGSGLQGAGRLAPRGGDAPRCVANADYFDRYFYFGVPPGDVSETEIETVLFKLRQPGSEADLARIESWLRENLDVVLPKLKALEASLNPFQKAHLLIAMARQYRESLARGEDLFQHVDFRDMAARMLPGLSVDAASLVKQMLTDATEFGLLLLLIRHQPRVEGRVPKRLRGVTGEEQVLLACAQKAPVFLAPQTRHELSQVQWCMDVLLAWAQVAGPEPVQDWMVCQLESEETFWKPEDLVGCCVEIEKHPVDGTFSARLDRSLLESIVPLPWLFEKLQEKLRYACEPLRLGLQDPLAFPFRVTYGLWDLRRLQQPHLLRSLRDSIRK